MAESSLVVSRNNAEPISYEGHQNPVVCYLLCSNDTRVLSYASPNELHLWQLSNGKQLFAYQLDSQEDFDVSADGNWLSTRLMIDSGNAQQEYLNIYYIGEAANQKTFALSYGIWLDVSNGLEYWFSDDCQTLWTQGEWNYTNQLNQDHQDEEFECLRSYSLKHQNGDPVIEMLTSEKLEYDTPLTLPDDLTNTKAFVAVPKETPGISERLP